VRCLPSSVHSLTIWLEPVVCEKSNGTAPGMCHDAGHAVTLEDLEEG
jgi:hypothetical protein